MVQLTKGWGQITILPYQTGSDNMPSFLCWTSVNKEERELGVGKKAGQTTTRLEA